MHVKALYCGNNYRNIKHMFNCKVSYFVHFPAISVNSILFKDTNKLYAQNITFERDTEISPRLVEICFPHKSSKQYNM